MFKGILLGILVLVPLLYVTAPKQQPAPPVIKKQEKAPEPTKTQIASSPSAAISVPILMYHYIGLNPNPETDKLRDGLLTTPDALEAELIKIKDKHMTPLTLDDLYAIYHGSENPPEAPIILTFDDGYVDFYINAYPLLQKYKIKATSFIPTGLIGKSNYLTWEMIEEMQKSGLVSFQAHTVTHPILTKLPEEKVAEELLSSKMRLEEKLGTKVNWLAYPYGISNEFVQAEASKAGFLGALTTHSGLATGINFTMPRVRSLN